MSKRRRKSKRKPRLSAAQLQSGIDAQLFSAKNHVEQGNYDRALQELQRIVSGTRNPGILANAKRLQAEAHLRNALDQPNQPLRLKQIDAALKIAPDSSRVRFYRGLTLWELERRQESLAEFEQVFEQQPNWPGLGFLVQLNRLALAKPWRSDNLSQTEARTLQLVQTLIQAPTGSQSDLPAGPFLGDAALWQALIDMAQNAEAAPTSTLAAAVYANADGAIVEIIRYYQGVSALRAGDVEKAARTWRALPASMNRKRWFAKNMSALQRLRVIQLAERERWREIADIADEIGDLAAEDAILSETIALAFNHIGHAHAQAKRWGQAVIHWRKANALHGSRFLAQNLALAAEAAGMWGQAAEAWRDMIRRRPRKETHADYLDVGQVAALWLHAAECYQEAEDVEQTVVCLKNARKYAGDDIDIRLQLVNALMINGQDDAAENELERALAIEPENAETLKLQASLYMRWEWSSRAVAVWEHYLSLVPDDPEAQASLAEAHLDHLESRWFMPIPQKIDYLLDVCKDLPADPRLASRLAFYYRQNKQTPKAIETLRQLLDARPQDGGAVGIALHELLHCEDDEEIEKALSGASALPGLLPGFWFSQIERAIECKVGEHWIDRFADEAIALTAQPYVKETKASILVKVCEILDTHGYTDLAQAVLQRLREEAPESGAVEYITAMSRLEGDYEYTKIRRLLKTARRLAKRAGEQSLLTMIEEVTSDPDASPDGLPIDLLDEMFRRFPDGPPSPEAMERLIDDYFNR